MKANNLFFKILDLFLVDEGSGESWVEIPLLRNSGYFLLTSIFVLILITLFSSAFPIHSSKLYTSIFRWIYLFGCLSCYISLMIVAYSYFKYIISNNRPIILSNILFFYICLIFVGGAICFRIYTIDPTTFIYINPAFEVSHIAKRSFDNLIGSLHFVLFSAFSTMNADFYRITSNSVVISIFQFFQTLFTLALIALFIASYINQRSYPKKGNKIQNTEQDASADAKKPRR